ncbi:hypothetical protein BST96_03960 [Oceanicoccus sagamiensis]|uniref:Solute-binding protein family 3/N-terminal domain-containing protein n=1 Tax=Oceanicoccus sagamiensis TaxID=716816 RepID=A0A1X9N8C5_9GAMM|nr:hypothetical protein BST96_03960 [Oceanicoccus sagamiensis]
MLWVLALVLFVPHLALAQAQTQCTDTLRLTVSTVKRSEDYLSVIKPFLATMAESLGKKPQLFFTDGWSASVHGFSQNSADLVLVPQSMLNVVHAKPELRPVIRTPGARVLLITEKSSTIRSMEQLRDKKVGTVRDSTEAMIAQQRLSQAGLLEAVELSSVVSPSDVYMGLFQDRFDAAFVIGESMDWLQPTFREKLVQVAEMGRTNGLFLYAGSCVSDAQLKTLEQALLSNPVDERVTRFIEHFNFGRFVAISPGDVEKALKQDFSSDQ